VDGWASQHAGVLPQIIRDAICMGKLTTAVIQQCSQASDFSMGTLAAGTRPIRSSFGLNTEAFTKCGRHDALSKP
jgi:hypothetical protein